MSIAQCPPQYRYDLCSPDLVGRQRTFSSAALEERLARSTSVEHWLALSAGALPNSSAECCSRRRIAFKNPCSRSSVGLDILNPTTHNHKISTQSCLSSLFLFPHFSYQFACLCAESLFLRYSSSIFSVTKFRTPKSDSSPQNLASDSDSRPKPRLWGTPKKILQL